MSTPILPETLQALIASVVAALGPKGGGVMLTYCCMDGAWGWGCVVEPMRRRHGNGMRVERSGISGYGDTPEEACAEVIRRCAIPGFLDL